MSPNVMHHVTTSTTRNSNGRTAFIVECTCGWRSRYLTTSGMAAAACAVHIEDPTRDADTI